MTDHEFDPISAEEQARRDEEEAFARRVRREMRRIQRGDADAEMQEEAAAEEAEREALEAERREREAREKRRQSSTMRQIVTGMILINGQTRRYYPYVLAIAAMSFLSIVVMFWSLHLDMRFSRLEREIQMLEERAMRMEEMRYRRTTRAAIEAELQRRNIRLEDPSTTDIIIP